MLRIPKMLEVLRNKPGRAKLIVITQPYIKISGIIINIYLLKLAIDKI